MRAWLRRNPIAGRIARRRGSLVVVTLWALVLVTGFTAAGLSRSTGELSVATHYRNAQRAFHAAEAGLDAMIWENIGGRRLLTHNTSVMNEPSSAKSDPCAGSIPCPKMGGAVISGGYVVTLGSATASVASYEDSIDSTIIRVRSTGTVAGTGLSRTLGVRLKKPGTPVFDYAIFALRSRIVSNGITTDSYNSSTGDYGSQPPGSNGDMGSNVNSCPGGCLSSDALDFRGPAAVNGDLWSGPGGRVQGAPGPVKILSAQKVGPPIPARSCGAVLRASSGTLPLAGGVVCYGEIDLSGSATVQFLKPTTVYVTGRVQLAGSSTLKVQQAGESWPHPTNLEVIVTGTTTAKLMSTSKFYGALYAPNAQVNLGNNTSDTGPSSAQVYGAVMAQELRLGSSASAINGTGVHFDEALLTDSTSALGSGGGSETTVVSWEQVP